MARFASPHDVWDGFCRLKDGLASAARAGRTFLRSPVSLRGSLRTHLFIFATSLMLPLLVLLGLALSSIVASETAKTRERLLRTAGDLSRDVDREVFGYLTVLKTLATSRTLERGELKDFHARAKMALDGQDAHVLLLDTQMQQLLNTRVPFGTPLPKTADEESARIVIETRRPYVSDAFLGSISRQRVINIETPVFLDGQLRYVLLITLEVGHFTDTLSGSAVIDDYAVALSDRKNAVIASAPNGNAALMAPVSIRPESKGGPTVFDYEDANGEQWVEASVWSDLTGWRTSVIAPASYVSGVLWMSIRWFCFALLAAVLLTIMLGTILGRRMAEPIREIRNATNELAEGKPIRPRNLPLREARSVMRSLNRAAELIASRSATLRASEEQSREQVRQIDTLMNELAHRNKNQLSVLLAMARQLGNTSPTLPEFMEKFAERVMAIAAAQDLVSRGISSGVPLRLLLESQMRPFTGEDSPQIAASGPDVRLTAEAARTIGMAFHELATNATKYGALREADGRISVHWCIKQPGARLEIAWRESGGPAVTAPARFGFGHTIIDRYVTRTLQADVSYGFPAEGIVWRMEADNLLV